ncbi:MAG: amidase, partial [Alphaproteobacteria bacterium]
ELAMKEAAARDEETAKGRIRGPLHGIPYGLKDLVDTAGIRTTWGAMPYKDRVPAHDAAVVEKLRAAGAVLLGKTTDGAIAYGDIWFGGKTRNPWNPLEGSSGSSAGSASATAAGLVAFSIGTETLGSIVSPSNRCGVVGLRPTFGRVSRHGAMALCWSLDKIGPICRHVADTALVLAAINGFDPRDAGSIAADFGWNAARKKKSLRIAYDEAWFKDAADTDKAALAALKTMPDVALKSVSLPDWPYSALFSVVEVEAAAAFQELTLSGRDDLMVWQDDEAWPNTWRRAHFFPAVDFVNAQRFRRRIMKMMWEKLDRAGIDALISPNYAGNLLVITNFTGHPCLTLPAGFIETPTRTGFGNAQDEHAPRFTVPRNVTLWGPLFREDRLLAIGMRLEQALGLTPKLRPPLQRWMQEYGGKAPPLPQPPAEKTA